MKKLTREAIAQDYPHRVDASPDTCPVCCGDERTTDRRYGGAVVMQSAMADVYSCRACAVWHGDHEVSVSNRDGVLRCDGCGGRVQLEDGQWVHARCLHSGCSEPVAFRATKLYGDHRSFYTCADHEPGRSRMEGIPIAYRVEPVR